MSIKEENYLGGNMVENFLLKALIKKLEGEIEVAKANILVYQRNSAGIGEHSDFVETIEKEVEKIADAHDKIEAIKTHCT
jgi:CRISPR/Cas system CSM-associated protein Csm2 small subunit